MRIKPFVLAAVLALGLAPLAHAQASPPTVKEICKADREHFCPDLDGQARKDCVLAHREKLSDACRNAIIQGMGADEYAKAIALVPVVKD